jgi:Sugar kinases, ribokinase family
VLHAAVPERAVVDATGAGDVFDAGFLDAWLDGRGLLSALREAAFCGAQAVTQLGGASAAPTRSERDEERNRT